jgi:hypothetical protein
MLVVVTADHIARGVRECCDNCPAALALQDAFPHHFVEVSDGMASIRRWGEAAVVVDLPPAAKRFVSRFDAGDEVEPFEFELPDAETL